jgi:transcriptional regulator with XRE-family HTH domain
MKTELTGAQVRMARALLRWSVTELAKKANVGISTVQRIEATDDPTVRDDLDWRASARAASIQAIYRTLIRAGITFLSDDGRGVGIRGKALKGSVRPGIGRGRGL